MTCQIISVIHTTTNNREPRNRRLTFISFTAPEKKNGIDYQINCVLENHLKHNTTYKAAEDSVQLINNSPGVRYTLPDTKYLLRKHAKSSIDPQYHVKCTVCNEYTAVAFNARGKSSGKCSHCMRIINKNKHDYFVYISIERQLQTSIVMNWKDIMEYADARKIIDLKDDQSISDIHDGKVFQDINKK